MSGLVPLSAGVGVYVHLPFCTSRCDYCAFATWTDRHELRAAYTDACVAHLDAAQRGEGRLAASLEPWPEVGLAATVYLGGGTPSQLEEADLTRLLEAVGRGEQSEVTIEANPEDVTASWARAARDAGATRISLGVQSLDPVVLGGLGRRHDPVAVYRAAEAIGEAGISSYSVDLIYGGAGESDESFLASLQGVLLLEPAPSHLSAYALTVEAGTPLSRQPGRHPDDDVQARRYELADELLTQAGFSWYEISNWARPGHEALHNIGYWDGGDYLAVGSAAHGHRAGHRWWNLRTPERYMRAVAAGEAPVAAEERLGATERRLEALELALRTRWGVPAECLPAGEEALEGLLEPGEEPGRLRLTLKGRLLANEVTHRLRPEAWDHLKVIERQL